MEKKKILCSQCGHKPFRNETGLSWHLWHIHGKEMATQRDLQQRETGDQAIIQKVLATAESSQRQKEGEARSETPDVKKFSAYEYINYVLDQAAAKKESAKK